MEVASFDTRDLLKRLERKATFHTAVDGIHSAVASCSPNNEAKVKALWPLVSRCHTLLKTRYSGPEAWRAGKVLFTKCLELPFYPREMASIRQFVKDANEVLEGVDVEQEGTQAASGDQLLSLADVLLEASREPNAHFDDTGPIVDDPERLRRVQMSGTATTSDAAPAASAGSNAAAAPGAGGAGGATEPAAARAARERAEQRAELQRAILDGIQAVYSGMDAVTRGTEHVERELDDIISIIHATRDGGAGGPRAAPPASRKVLAALPRVVLSEAELARLGPDSVCAVCTEELRVGDEVQLMPCKHSYHVVCLKPWLDKHNSCPVCRHELPTDDAKYEAQKEKAKEEEEDRRGAANALSHNERMYT